MEMDMKNFVSGGEVVALAAAPYAVASGAGCLQGSIFGVAQSAAASGAPVNLVTTGIYDLVKTDSQAWTLGQKIYWDNSTKACTTAAAAGANALIGVALAAYGSGAGLTTGRVRLSGAMTI
jgi:predicted RecA/RadA family phage recombinase